MEIQPQPNKGFFMTHIVHANNFDRFEKKVKAIQNKAAKLGLEAPKYTVVRRFTKEVVQDHSRYEIPCVELDIVDAKVAMSGWSFAATIDHKETTNIIRMSPKFEGDQSRLLAYSNAKSVCEHCKTSRLRKNTYIMASENGALMQVGTSCIKDFIGHPTAEYYAELYELLMIFDQEERERGFGKYKRSFDVRSVLEVASSLVRTKGYVSRNMKGMPTSTGTLMAMTLSDKAYTEMFGGKAPEVTDADKKMAQDCIDLVMSFDENDLKNVFNHNLRTLVEDGYVLETEFGMICYLPEMLSKTLTKKAEQWEKEKAEREARAKSDFIGSVSEKVIVQASYLGKIYLGSNHFSDSYLHRFKSGENQIVWSSANTLENFTAGQTVEITGIVKDHQTYRDVKQTRLTRCKVKSLQ